jgi:hypothetical protein
MENFNANLDAHPALARSLSRETPNVDVRKTSKTPEVLRSVAAWGGGYIGLQNRAPCALNAQAALV